MNIIKLEQNIQLNIFFLPTISVCSSTLCGDPVNSMNNVGSTGYDRCEYLLAASNESSSRNSTLATGTPACSISTVLLTAGSIAGKLHTRTVVWGERKDIAEREEKMKWK